MIAFLGLTLGMIAALLLFAGYRPAGGKRGSATPRSVRAAGWLAAATTLAVLLLHFGAATAVFVLLVTLMLGCSLAPLLFAWVARDATPEDAR